MVSIRSDCSDFEHALAPIALIAAHSSNNVIGCSNELPWRQKDDLQRFRRATLGKPVIVGRRTYESIGKPLAGRLTIVLTRNEDYAKSIRAQCTQGLVSATSIFEAISLANEYLQSSNSCDADKEIMVAGGQEIFEAFVKCCQKIYLTVIDAVVDGDAYFPDQSQFSDFACKFVGQRHRDAENQFDCNYFEYHAPAEISKFADNSEDFPQTLNFTNLH